MWAKWSHLWQSLLLLPAAHALWKLAFPGALPTPSFGGSFSLSMPSCCLRSVQKSVALQNIASRWNLLFRKKLNHSLKLPICCIWSLPFAVWVSVLLSALGCCCWRLCCTVYWGLLLFSSHRQQFWLVWIPGAWGCQCSWSHRALHLLDTS